LSEQRTPQLKLAQLVEWCGISADDTLELLYRLQSLALLCAVTQPVKAPKGALEAVLVEHMRHLSGRGRVLLADNQGLCIAGCGFAHETTEELAGMSAALLGLCTLAFAANTGANYLHGPPRNPVSQCRC
jgi:hypothetical protein